MYQIYYLRYIYILEGVAISHYLCIVHVIYQLQYLIYMKWINPFYTKLTPKKYANNLLIEHTDLNVTDLDTTHTMTKVIEHVKLL